MHCGGNNNEQAAYRRRQAQTPFQRVVQQPSQSRNDRALSRALPQLRPDPARAAIRQADHRHRADRQRSVAVQPPPPRIGPSGPGGHPRRRRHRHGISGASDPGDRQAPHRGAGPQPRLSRPGRTPVRLPPRRRGADHRLRQDHPGLPDGGGHRQHAGDRAVGRPDAQWLAQGAAHRLRHRGLESPRGACRWRYRLRGVHEYRGLVGAVGRPLQHHGHRLHHEFAGGGPRHVAAGLCRDPRPLPRARPDRLRDRHPHRRAWSGRI